jgi:hypothetical protein
MQIKGWRTLDKRSMQVCAAARPHCGMELGSNVIHQGRLYVLLGVDPMNVSNRRAYLHDVETDDMVEVPYAEIGPAPEPPDSRGFEPAA